MRNKIKSFLPNKFPNRQQIKSLPKILNKKERLIFATAFSVFIISLISLSTLFYLNNTEIVPANGGKYTEGLIGSPRFLNPVYSSANDVDRDITSLLFSGLMKHSTSGELLPEMIEGIEKEGQTFIIKLKEGLRWSDGEMITADDLIFTIKTIQNPDYRSPLRPDWVGIRVEKISDNEVLFELEQESSAFLNKLSLRMIPFHIWKDVPAQNFPLSRYNLNPVGSGPYRLKNINENQWGKIESIELELNPFYHGNRPHIEQITFVFFDNKEDLLEAARKKEIQGFSVISPKNYKEIIRTTRFTGYRFHLPRYFALFFNLERPGDIKDIKIRQAINYAINKEEIIELALSGRGTVVNSPILPVMHGLNFEGDHEFNPEKSNKILDELGLRKNTDGFRERIIQEQYVFSFTKDLNTGAQGEEVRELQRCLIFLSEDDSELFPDGKITGFYGTETRDAVVRLQEKYREEILSPSGFSKGTGMVAESTRLKLNELCGDIPEKSNEISFTISTVDQLLMIETAEIIKKQLENIGIRVYIEAHDRGTLERDVIKPRDYEIILFGKAFESIPDPFPFWHSSQKSEFGLNLAMYENEKVDVLLEDIRKETSQSIRNEKLESFQEIVINDIPAVFLYNPDFLYFIDSKIKAVQPGRLINPSDRFLQIENWHIKTKRVWVKNN